MATWINSGWPFIIYQGQQEFCISTNLTHFNHCKRTYSKGVTLIYRDSFLSQFVAYFYVCAKLITIHCVRYICWYYNVASLA